MLTLFFAGMFYVDSLKILYNKKEIKKLIAEKNTYNEILKIPSITKEEEKQITAENELFIINSKDKNDFSYLMLFKPIYLKSTLMFIVMITCSAMVSLTNIYTLPLIFKDNNKKYKISSSRRA